MRIAYALAAALAAGSIHAQPHSPLPPSKPAPCSPVPKSWKLGKPVAFDEVDKRLKATHEKLGWGNYKKGRRSFDKFHEFDAAREQGYAVIRNGCLNSYFITVRRK